jgi:hypothetical protein
VSEMPTQQLYVSAIVGFLCAVVYFWNSKGNAYDIVTWNNLNSQCLNSNLFSNLEDSHTYVRLYLWVFHFSIYTTIEGLISKP